MTWKERFNNLQKEFNNFKVRSEKEKIELEQSAGKDVLIRLIEIKDDVDRALVASKTTKDANALVLGLDLISKKLENLIKL